MLFRSRDAGGGILAGKYEVAYRVTVSGQYNLQITRYGLSIKDSPAVVEIDPGAPTASTCTTHPVQASDGLGMIGGRQNTELSFTVYARDQFGNIAKKPSIESDLKVTVTDPEGSPLDAKKRSLAGGRYKVSYTPESSGDHTLSVKIRDVHIVGSPYTVAVLGQFAETGTIADNRFSTIIDDDAVKYLINTVNTIKTFPMQMRDNIGKDMDTSGGARFDVLLEGVQCRECAQYPTAIGVDYSCCIDHREDPPTITYYSMKAGLARLDVYMIKGDEITNPAILNSPDRKSVV